MKSKRTHKSKQKRTTTPRKKAGGDADLALINQAVEFYLKNKRLKAAEGYAVRGAVRDYDQSEFD